MLGFTLAVGILILQDTGEQRGGLPVFRHHPDAARYEQILKRGFAGRLLRLYEIEQRLSHPEREPEPAILCLTQNQGGFPRKGFVLDGTARQSAYVDLHERSDLTGRHGAIDQIFPHELMHIILKDLAGPRDDGHATQVHAIGVTTDRLTAFDEGFAEHAQVMSIDAADAAPDTRALAHDAAGYQRALENVEAYRRALTARWAIAPRAVLTFPFWFSGSEQVLRYHAVRLNLFAREPSVGRVTPSRAYNAYLLDNVLPGTVSDPRKPIARLLATEGVISALFVRWMTDSAIQDAPAPPAVYARFGVRPGSLDALDNAYVKVWAAFAEHPHDVVAFVRAYEALFPGERDAVQRVVDGVFGVPELPDVPEVWLVNEDMPNGRSLFDQFRALPHAHGFDLNAASMGDLLGVPGVDVDRARAIRAAAPYRSVLQLDRVPGLDAAVRQRFERMAERARQPDEAVDESLTIRALLMPYARYAAIVLVICAVAAALVYRGVRRVRWWRAALNGTAVAVTGLLIGWSGDNGSGIVGWMLPVILFGVPATAIAAWRSRKRGRTHSAVATATAGVVFAAWALAALVPALILRPIG